MSVLENQVIQVDPKGVWEIGTPARADVLEIVIPLNSISTRLRKLLSRNSIRTLGELATAYDPGGYQNAGKVTIREARDLLKSYGITPEWDKDGFSPYTRRY